MIVKVAETAATIEIDYPMGFAIPAGFRLYFGLGREHSLTLEEIGEKFQLTRERVRQIKEKAIRRLRHASRSKQLRAYLG